MNRPVALTSVVMEYLERLALAHLKDITCPLLDLQFAVWANKSVDDTVNRGLHYILQYLYLKWARNITADHHTLDATSATSPLWRYRALYAKTTRHTHQTGVCVCACTHTWPIKPILKKCNMLKSFTPQRVAQQQVSA